MAQSRLERIGTIYTRTKSLLKVGAMKQESTPLWYAIYEAFPPKLEPLFDREVPDTPIRKIFYKEDIIRAKFQREHKNFLQSNLFNAKSMSNTQRFLAKYKEMEESGTPMEELYPKALEEFRASMGSWRQSRKETNEDVARVKDKDGQIGEVKVDLKKVFEE